MALLGFHIVLSLIAATLFNKFSTQLALSDKIVWMGLRYFWLPEPPQPNDGARGKRRGHKPTEISDFKSKVLCLDMSPEIMTRLTFYTPLTWLVDYSLLSLAVFTLSQTWVFIFPQDQSTNISVLWCLFSITFAMQILCKIQFMKISKPELTSERNLIFCFALVSFFTFMLLNMFGDRLLAYDLSETFDVLLKNSMELASQRPDQRPEKASPLLLYILASVFSSFISCILMFPMIQYALLFRNRTEGSRSFSSAMHGIIFTMPFFIMLLYIQPVKNLIQSHFPLINEDLYALLRIALVLVWSTLRLISTKPLLQCYLEKALTKAVSCSKHQDAFETLRSHLSLLAMTAIQLIGPALLVLFSALAELGLGQILRPGQDSRIDNNLQVITDPKVQRIVWAHLSSVLLVLQGGLAAMGLYFS